jgi:hypothetical protein
LALALYLVVAAVVCLLLRRIIGKRAALVLIALPLVFTAPAMFTNRTYAPLDLLYTSEPFKSLHVRTVQIAGAGRDPQLDPHRHLPPDRAVEPGRARFDQGRRVAALEPADALRRRPGRRRPARAVLPDHDPRLAAAARARAHVRRGHGLLSRRPRRVSLFPAHRSGRAGVAVRRGRVDVLHAGRLLSRVASRRVAGASGLSARRWRSCRSCCSARSGCSRMRFRARSR